MRYPRLQHGKKRGAGYIRVGRHLNGGICFTIRVLIHVFGNLEAYNAACQRRTAGDGGWVATYNIDSRTDRVVYLCAGVSVCRSGKCERIHTTTGVGDAELVLLVYGKAFLCFTPCVRREWGCIQRMHEDAYWDLSLWSP